VIVLSVSVPASVFVVAFAAQAAAMAVDECRFHRRRGLPRWERIGHPLDTITVLACYGWLVAMPPSRPMLFVYGGLVAFSSLFVTKDEPLHARRCTPGEHWVHALLFVIHPIVLGAAGAIWWYAELPHDLFAIPLGLTGLFGLYQVAYWHLKDRRGTWRRPP
jgi:hypothetical protein